MQVMNGMVSRRSWLLALATLSALLAVAALTLAPARAAPPSDLALSLSLIGDSDNVVPAGEDLMVAAKLTYTDASSTPLVTGGMLRVSGSHEWESNGRSSLGIRGLHDPGEPSTIANTGWSVAVEERTSGGDIVVVGAYRDTVNTLENAGSADLFVGGHFVKQLTAGDNVEEGARFGQGVAVGGGYIVISAPAEGDGSNGGTPGGAVYIFDVQGNQIAKLTPGADAGAGEDAGGWPINRFGDDVAIDDAGETIAVIAKSSEAQKNTSTVYVFEKPTDGDGWDNRNTNDVPALSSSHADHRFGNPAGVAISGDGDTIVQTFEDADKSAVAVHVKPSSGGWVDAVGDAAITLTTMEDHEEHRIGASVDISDDGGTIVASGNSRYAASPWGSGPTATGVVIQNEGRAYVWERGSGAWASHDDDDAVLTNPGAAGGDLFGHDVAISGDGQTIAVSNAWAQANDYAAGEAHVFVRSGSTWADSSAGTALTSPQDGDQLFFGYGVAIDGDTLVVGQPEALRFITQRTDIDAPIGTGHGRAFTFDLSSNLEDQLGAVLVPCTTSTDEVTTYTCSLETVDAADDAVDEADVATITIPAGTPDGTFTISGSVNVDGAAAAYTATLEVTIGTVDEVAEVAFDFATDSDGAPLSSTIKDGESTTLQLSVLNENGTASAAGNLASVLFTTTSGTLDLVKPASGCSGTGSTGLACQVMVDDLDATNSDAIQVELTHPGQSGTATVSARVLSIAGASFAPAPLEIIFTGVAETLAISEPATSLLNVATTDEGDDRDVLTLSVSAEDKNGNTAAVPDTRRSVTLKDPDGKTVASGETVSDDDAATTENTIGFKVETDDNGVEQDVLDAARNPQVVININATEALATGAYTLEVKAGGKTATQTINVSAGAAAVALSLDGAAEIGQRVTVKAEITDADGAAVADGTPVSFTEGSAQANPALVRVSADTKTTDGAASAVYLVVASGTAFVTVGSGDSASDVLLIQTTLPTPEAVPPVESLSSTAADDYSSYMGAAATTASELLDSLDGVNGILLWDGSAWQRYSVADGREVPGSVDFTVTAGSILWLSG